MDAYPVVRRMRRLTGPVGALADLGLPASCAGCGRLGTAWCRDCAHALGAACAVPGLVGGAAGRACRPYGPVLAAGAYAGVLRTAVVAFKDRGRRDLVHVLSPPMRGVLVTAVQQARTPDVVFVVAAPVGAGARRERGDVPLHLLVRRALGGADVLSGRECVWAPVLRHARTVADQVGLSRERRAANLDGAFRVVDAGVVRGRAVVVADDVVTTGATAAECVRVLTAAGARPVAVAALAATPHDR